MMHILHLIGLPGVAFFLIALILILTLVFKLMLHHHKNPVTQPHVKTMDEWVEKKYPDVDVETVHPLIWRLSLIITMFVLWLVLEYPSFDKQTLVKLQAGAEVFEEEMKEIPITQQLPPPPPPIRNPSFVVVANTEAIETTIDVKLDVEIDEETAVEEYQAITKVEKEEVEEKAEEIFEVVEESAAPEGGVEAFYQYLAKNIEYPLQARQLRVEGKVYVQFVIDKTGKLTDAVVIRGIGAGCDEEAVRVMLKAPAWKPGKQRGRPVKQRMVVPIAFKLAN